MSFSDIAMFYNLIIKGIKTMNNEIYELSEHLNVITGPNGSGKTRLLEKLKQDNLLNADVIDNCGCELSSFELVKYAKHEDKGVELVGLNVKDKRKPAKQLMDDVNVNYDVYVAQDDFLEKFKSYNIPTTLFVDKTPSFIIFFEPPAVSSSS